LTFDAHVRGIDLQRFLDVLVWIAAHRVVVHFNVYAVIANCHPDPLGHIFTYADLAADTNRVGNGLLRLGLQEEQRVLLLLPDSPEFAVAYFGVIKIGAVALPTSTAAQTADYDYFLRESRARILIVDSTLFSKVAPGLSWQGPLRHVIVVGEPQRGCLHWDEWLAQNSPELGAAKTNEEDVAFVDVGQHRAPEGCGTPAFRLDLLRQELCCPSLRYRLR